MNPQLKTSPELSESFDSQKLWVLKWTCHKIAGVAMWLVMMTWVAWCKPQDANAQTAPPIVEAEMSEAGVVKTAQLSQTVQPKVINASVSTSEEAKELDISTLSRDQILKEIESIDIKIAKLEAGIDSFTDDDPRWDILDWYAEERSKLRDAQLELSWRELAVEKERTRKSELLAWINN